MRSSSSAGSLIQWGTASWSNGNGAAYRAQAGSGKCPTARRRLVRMPGPRVMAYSGGPISVEPGLRGVCRIVVLALLLAGCTRNPGEPARDEQAGRVAQAHAGLVTISGADTLLESLPWRPQAG